MKWVFIHSSILKPDKSCRGASTGNMFTILNLMERRSSNRFVGLKYSVIKSDAYFDSIFNEFIVNKSIRTKKRDCIARLQIFICIYMNVGLIRCKKLYYLLFAIAKNPLASLYLSWCFTIRHMVLFFFSHSTHDRHRTCLVNRNKFCTFLRT